MSHCTRKAIFNELQEAEAGEQLTGRVDLARYIRNILSHDNGKATKRRALQYTNHDDGRRNDRRVQVPIDVAVEEPRARIVGDEADGDLIICASANAYDVAHDWVDPVVLRAVRATDDVECMLVGAV